MKSKELKLILGITKEPISNLDRFSKTNLKSECRFLTK